MALTGWDTPEGGITGAGTAEGNAPLGGIAATCNPLGGGGGMGATGIPLGSGGGIGSHGHTWWRLLYSPGWHLSHLVAQLAQFNLQRPALSPFSRQFFSYHPPRPFSRDGLHLRLTAP